MKRIMLPVLVLAVIAAVLAGCSSGSGATPTPSEVALGQQFGLSPGQSQKIAGEDLTLKFIAVTADSRCPSGAQCIQAGQAVCQLEATSRGQTTVLSLVETGLTSGTAASEMGLYKIAFQVTPYPEVGKQIRSSDYKLLMTVTK